MTMIERISPPTAATAITSATRTMKLPVRSRCWSFQFLVAIILIYYQQVQAVFYKDICQTGPMYKVRIDPMTGKLVPVVQEDPFSKAEEDAKENGGMVDGVYYNNGNPFASDYHDNVNKDKNENNNNNNNNENDGLLTPNINRDSSSNTNDDDPVGAIMIGNGIQTENENDQSSYEYEDRSQIGDGTRRVLRSNRIWREYETTESGDDDESSTTQAIQIDAHYYDTNSNSNSETTTTTIGRRLIETTQRWLAYSGFYDGADDDLMVDLEEGEFYVKPCLCESSRWTFPETAEPSLPKTVYNDTTDTIIQNVTNDTTTTPTTTTNSNNSPDDDEFTSIIGNDGFYSPNLGQHSNGQYILVPHNNPDADLYLCHVQAMYCGIPIDIDQDGVHAVCFDQNMRHIIARNAWPLILLWYFGLAVICCCTVHGRTAGDFVRDRLVTLVKTLLSCCFEVKYDFNDRMLDRMIEDDEEQRGRRRRGSDNTNTTSTTTGNNNNNNSNNTNNDNDASNSNNTRNSSRPWFYSNQRRQFERSLHAQVQWIWRHQEYLRELSLREQGLPPPQLKLKIKKFRLETTTSASREGGFGTSIGGNNNNTAGDNDTDNNEDDNDATAKDAQQQQQQQQQTPLEVIDTKRSIDSPKSTDKKPRRRGSFGSALRRNSDGSTSSRRNSNDSQRYGRRNSNDSQKSKKSKPKRRASGDALLKVLGIDKDKAASTPCTICPKELDAGSPSTDAEELDVVQINLTTPQDGQDDTDGLAKTTITIDDDDDDVDSLDVPTCTICFCPFEEGDLIGDLSCKHEFHVECLKGWVQCKNACPLCNVRLGKPERPLPEDTRATETNNTTNDSDETAEGTQPRNSLRNVVRFLNTSYFQPRTTHSSSSNNNNNNTSTNNDDVAPGAGAGEIRRASRIGILGSISAANDIAYAQTHRSTQRR